MREIRANHVIELQKKPSQLELQSGLSTTGKLAGGRNILLDLATEVIGRDNRVKRDAV
jgi:hypothetical protein